MRSTEKSTTGTSFHNTTLVATINDLKKVLGPPVYKKNTGNGKTNFEWEGETESGKIFTVYDWKENRPLSNTEDIRWHIGGFNYMDTMEAREEILEAIIKIS